MSLKIILKNSPGKSREDIKKEQIETGVKI